MKPLPDILSTLAEYMPISVAQHISALLMAQIMRRHRDLFERLGEHRCKRFAFAPSDLPLAFVVSPNGPSVTVCRKPPVPEADAAVEGPLFMLLALLEGRQDADALFFSRDLTVTGDMEAMLALRNALDDSNIDLPNDLGAMAGPLAPLVSRVACGVRSRVLAEGEASWS
ncbi:ubiquinone anaerobic biosynthesis accessory factor UbiT [Pseudochelatococcus contaminans]|uniref:Putative lipid carrier protein YhbT n=1 Tax=Pseudochelatococcus contaminans TaxID=1538103 RepID=A0A7W5Z3R9_9HYPH|nr:SCP2 sterol-binding domain-containing protein [Pseudochelatococcus contaminans]MBB3809207.1 putative lipid carrier protein YhbT [Pseudochelatococcus contaminans]